MNTEKIAMHTARLETVREFVGHNIDRPLLPNELASLERLNEQDLHLLAAAIIEATS
jgi:hypothetical protein